MEAVDKKNPRLICCATVDAIKDDQIHIAFDGWQGTFDYWARYDSRDIFPVNWCIRSGHAVQPPGDRNKIDPNTNKRKSLKPSNTFIPELDSLHATTTPVTIHFHEKCKTGPFIDRTRIRSMTSAPNYKALAKLCLQEIISSCIDSTQIAQRLFALDGEVNVVTVGNRNFTVKMPESINLDDSEMLKFLQSVCAACESCPNLITLEAGPDQCDDCSKQRKIESIKNDRHKQIETNNDIAKEKTFEKHRKDNGKGNVIKPQQPFDQHPQQPNIGLQNHETFSESKQQYKIRRRSDIDTESSLSSTSTSSIEHFVKIPKKSIEDSVHSSDTTSEISIPTQTVTTTSISSKCYSVFIHCICNLNKYSQFFFLIISHKLSTKYNSSK